MLSVECCEVCVYACARLRVRVHLSPQAMKLQREAGGAAHVRLLDPTRAGIVPQTYLWIVDCGLWIVDCGLCIVQYAICYV